MKTLSLLLILILSNAFTKPENSNRLMPKVEQYVNQVTSEFSQIPGERQSALKEIAGYVQSKVKSGETAKLTFICTHNSRRSHISQIWAQAAAHYYGIKGVETFSGGTEATAFNPRAVKAMQETGLEIKKMNDSSNPVYEVKYAEDAQSLKAYSKVYDADKNPTRDFAAIMTCSEADKNCPFIPGANLRIPIPYEDPKAFDGTDKEVQAYRERCEQIAREMFYLFSQVRN